MKCLISIGLILPALAAVIGVAAWAVSADVVMNSANRGGAGVRSDNGLLQQNYAVGTDNRPDIFRFNNAENRRLQNPPTTSTTTTSAPSSTTSTTTTTTTTTTPAPPKTLSPQEATDVNAIISKLISASGAASGGAGPRFVVVAPLPDNPSDLLPGAQGSQSGIARVDHDQNKDNPWKQVGGGGKKTDRDLEASASSHNPTVELMPSSDRSTKSKKEVNRRISEKAGSGPTFNIELSGFDGLDSLMKQQQQQEALMESPSIQHHGHLELPPPSFGGYKRGPPKGHHLFPPRSHPQEQQQHMFHPPPAMHAFQPNPQGPIGIGLKPIQQQQLHHHMDSGAQLQAAESGRWGSIAFPPLGGYVHKPPEGISIGISSPAGNGAHVSAEPVSVIKSIFLPFLPRPKLNMNARVVFGVVLDKGMGIDGSKKSHHHLG